jgi:hypothetical protein
MELIVKFTWDSDASVWIATSQDVPGLVLESGSFDALVERVRYAVPELLELNGVAERNIPLCIQSERHERTYA